MRGYFTKLLCSAILLLISITAYSSVLSGVNYYREGLNAYRIENYEEGLSLLNKSIAQSKIENDSVTLAKSYWVKGLIHIILENHRMSNSNFEIAYQISQNWDSLYDGAKYKFANDYALSLQGLGLINEAITILQYSLKDAERMSYYTLGAHYINLAVLEAKRKNFSNSMLYFQKARPIVNMTDSIALTSAYYNELGYNYYGSLNIFDSALYFTNKAYLLDLKENNIERLHHSSKNLSELHSKQSNYNKAYTFLKESNQYKQLIDKLALNNRIAELNVKHKTKQKENDLKIQALKLIQHESKLDNERNTKLSLIFIIFIISLFSFWLSYLLRKNMKAFNQVQSLNKAIRKMNDDLEKKVDERTASLKEQNERLKKYSYLNSHKVRAPLSKVMGLTRLVQNHPSHEHFEMLESSAHELDDVIIEINHMLQDERSLFALQRRMKVPSLVYLIDDDPIQNILSSKIIFDFNPNIKVIEFTKAQEAIERLKLGQDLPDVIFLDLNMPDMDGWGFLDALQKNHLSFPTALLTSSVDPSDRKRSEQYKNINVFIPKPLDIEELKRIFGITITQKPHPETERS